MNNRSDSVEVQIYSKQSSGQLRHQARRYYCAKSLFNGSREVYILHGEQQYKLSITRQDKLILTR